MNGETNPIPTALTCFAELDAMRTHTHTRTNKNVTINSNGFINFVAFDSFKRV